MLLLELIDNLALLISISVIYDLIGVVPKESSRWRRLFAGVLFGAAAVIGMMSPMHFAPGVIYDGRSIILTAAGVMTGGAGGVVAAIPAVAYRLYLGGAGATAGVAVIVTSVGLGVAGFYLRRRSPWWSSTLSLAIVGFVVHTLMLLWQLLFLPDTVGAEVLHRVGLLILLVYPAVFVLVARFLIDREEARALAREARRGDKLYRSLFENTHAVMFAIRPEDGAILDANPAAESFYGWSREELRSMRIYEINVLTEEEVNAEIERAREAGQGYFEFRHRLADGTVRDVAVRSGPAPVGGAEVLHSVVFDITGRKEAERAIEASLREKESLLREIHHRVKNNLAVMSSLINIQVGSAENWEQAFGALEKTRDRINTMGEVHNNLYSSGDFSRLDFCDFLSSRVEGLSLSYGDRRPIELSVRCPGLTVDVEIAIPLGLLVNELVTNAFKHAFGGRDGGEIVVSVEPQADTFILKVADNGSGLPESPEGAEPGGVGLQLVRLLAEQIDATVRFSTNEGTVAEVVVPLRR